MLSKEQKVEECDHSTSLMVNCDAIAGKEQRDERSCMCLVIRRQELVTKS